MTGKTEAGRTVVERTSDRDLVITRRFAAPQRLLFAAWTTPDLLKRWWVPQSTGMELAACDIDVRSGGAYRFQFAHNGELTMAFFGTYLDVTPPMRLVWTNEESEEGALSTVTFEEQGGSTLLTLHEVYPTKQSLDQSCDGMENFLPEQFSQLDEVLAALKTS